MAENRSSGASEGENINSLVGVLLRHPTVRTVISARQGQETPADNSPRMNEGSTRRPSFESPQQEFRSIFNRASFFPPSSLRAGNRINTSRRNRVAGPYSSTSTRGRSSQGSVPKLFHREVVLLDCPEDRRVKRGSQKAELVRKGQVISMFQMDKSWGEHQVINALQDAFNHALSGVSIEPKFTFLMAVGCDLIEPSLTAGQCLDAEMIRRLFSQKTIWLSSKQSLVRPRVLGESTTCTPMQQALTSSFTEVEESFPSTSSASTSTNECEQTDTDGKLEQTMHFLVEAGFEREDALKAVNMCGETATLEEYTEYLLNPVTDTGKSTPQEDEMSLQSYLQKQAESSIDHERPLYFEVQRSEIWKRALTFYKQAMASPKVLTRNFLVEFLGEEGVDAGALKAEYFGELLKEMNRRMFEGSYRCRVPKKSFQGGSSHVFAGMMIGHSLLQNGPGYPCLAPSLYSYVVTGSDDAAMDQIPSVSSIPVNASTATFHKFITKFDSCNSDEEINDLLDDDHMGKSYMEVVNGSGWPPTESINMKSKASLIQQLVVDELIHKRKTALDEIRRGLSLAGVLPLLEAHSVLFKEAFVYCENPITPIQLKEMLAISSRRPSEYPQSQSYDWFMEYIDSCENAALEERLLHKLLQFWTGYTCVPPMGLPHPLKIEYLSDDDTKVLPEAHTCFAIIQLPVVHTNKEQFFNMIEKALEFGSKGFGLL